MTIYLYTEMARRQQRGWSPQRNNYWDRGSRYDQNRRWRSDRSPVGTRFRKFDRSSSRSRSRSASRSHSRSYSRSRSRSPSVERNRSRTPETRSRKKHRSVGWVYGNGYSAWAQIFPGRKFAHSIMSCGTATFLMWGYISLCCHFLGIR